MQAQAPQPPPLQQLPVPLLLLTLAIAARQQAKTLEPHLAVKPNPASQAELAAYGQVWQKYLQHQHDSVGCLSALVELGPGNMTGGQRIVLRARGMLVEWLTEGGVNSGAGMAEGQIGKALQLAQTHPSFFQFQLYFLSHQARLSMLGDSPNPRLARTTLRRALALLDAAPPPPGTPYSGPPTDPAGNYPQWRYHLLIQLASVATPPNGPTDFPAALAAWREVAALATRRDDPQILALASLSLARLHLEQGSHVAGPAVLELGVLLGYAAEDLPAKREEPAAKAAREGAMRARVERSKGVMPETVLRVQGALIYCLWCVEEGRVTEAKFRLREMHKLLDEKVSRAEAGTRQNEDGGFVQLAVRPYAGTSTNLPANGGVSNATLGPTAASVTVMISPWALVYKFAYLASLGVYRDPYGTTPKSIAFGKQGIDLIDRTFEATPGRLPAQLPPHAIATHLSALASIRLSLQIYLAEVALLRSDFTKCTSTINDLIATARQHNVWDTVAPRVCLIQGMLHQAKGEDQAAYDTLAAVESGRAGEDEGAQLGARLALLILGMSRGIAIRLDSTRAGQGAGGCGGGRMELDEMARRFVEEAERGPPSWRLAGEFVRAMACGEITKSKQHLSDALKFTNTLGANHARALMLALLGNLYLHTRNGEAQKMLQSALQIAQGLGPRADERTAEQKAADKAAGRLGDDVVGASRLGLWCGTQLLETYKGQGDVARARAQWEVNEAHRRVLDKEARARVQG